VDSEIIAAMDADADGAALAAMVRRLSNLSGRSDLRFVNAEPFGSRTGTDRYASTPFSFLLPRTPFLSPD